MGRLEEYYELLDVKRRGWDKSEPKARLTRGVSDITEFELHHTGAAGPRSLSFEDKQKWLLSIERYHEKTKRWSDIFYQTFVFADGEIWEGRDLRRASTSKASKALTVHIPGNSPAITPAQHASLMRVARWATGGDPSKVRGHSDRSATACPGDSGRSELDAIKLELSAPAAPAPAAAAPARGPRGPKGDKGDKGDPGEVTPQQVRDAVRRELPNIVEQVLQELRERLKT